MAHGRRWRYGTGLSGVKGARSVLGAWLAACACGVMAQSAQPAPGVPMADLPPAVVSAPLPDVGSMASRVLACTACHGPEGRATPSGYFPRIAGKPAGYLYRQLKNFQQGRRSYPAMNRLIEFMSDDYLRQIAVHFASLELPYAPPVPAQLPPADLARGEQLVLQGDAQRGLPACAACHGQRLMGAGDDIPGLLGLSRDYLNSQIGAWRSGQRQAAAPDCMDQVAKALTPQEVVAVTAWLSSRPASATPGGHEALARSLPLRCGAVAAVGGQEGRP
ncbi:c-type cytochrome [Delftia tsuruhatensis]